MIAREAPPGQISRLCAAIGLSRATFYRYRDPDEPVATDVAVRDQIQRIAIEFPAYGYRRITAQLRRDGVLVNRKRVLRLMREDNLLCLRHRRFLATTDSDHGLPVYPNLVPTLTLTGINQLWVAEIVCSQMTKAHLLALRAGGDDVADLHLPVRHDHPVDQQLHQLTPLREGRARQSAAYPLAERLDRRDHLRDLRVTIHLRSQLLCLAFKSLTPLFQIAATTLIFRQRDHRPEIGTGLPAPPHSHDGYEETIYGVEGVLTWTVDGTPFDVQPGEALCIPQGAVHAFMNNGATDARALCVISPGVLGPAYFREMGAVIAAAGGGPPDCAKAMEVMRRHGLTPAAPPAPS